MTVFFMCIVIRAFEATGFRQHSFRYLILHMPLVQCRQTAGDDHSSMVLTNNV